jgi:hypothetical protein
MKSEVYSWRVSAQRKADLEAEARSEGASLAELLDGVTAAWLAARRGTRIGEEAEQQRLQALAGESFGAISGGDLHRSARTRETIRQRLQSHHAAHRPR